MERVVVSEITDHLETNNIFCNTQHSFGKLRLCETQLLELLEELTSNLDKGHQTDVVVTDFAKAFGGLNHSVLCHNLDLYGIRNQANSWISGFLRGRRQAVIVDGPKSDFIPERSGVPQGSVRSGVPQGSVRSGVPQGSVLGPYFPGVHR